MDQLPRLGKRELICLVLFTCNYVVSVGEVSSSSGCLGWATLFYFIPVQLVQQVTGSVVKTVNKIPIIIGINLMHMTKRTNICI